MSDNNLTTTDDQNSNDMTQFEEAEIIENTGNIEVRDFDAVDDDHPLVEYAGQSAMQTDANGGGEFISEAIYDHDKAWVREWLQNAEAACVRAAKLLIQMSDEYPDGWLTHSMWVDSKSGETVIPYDSDQSALSEYQNDDDAANLRELEVPRPIDEVLQAARSLGYDPTIEWEVYMDERQIVTTDNGDGMTPRLFWEAFESPFSSGSGVDGDTGGKFGVGSESVRIVYGDEGGAEVETRSRRPGGHEGFRGYTYSGGATAIPGEVDDDFYGTRFKIPVQEGFNLQKLQSWVEEYVGKLRVPVKYEEYDAGTTRADEEYEATSFVDDYDDPPVVIERPGEFSVVAGPDVIDTGYNADDDDTFLVSMPIDRNTNASINTFWEVAIQIHDEQGRIVAGPNRGEHREDVELHEDDIPLPEPTGDRDRLTRDANSKDFFYLVKDVVKAEEMKEIADLAERMNEAHHPADAIRDNESDWTLFTKMVNYHGTYNVTDNKSKFMSFLDDRDEFPDFDDKTASQVYNLFSDVEYCHRSPKASKKKSSRMEKSFGQIISEKGAKKVYMAASTGGNFVDYFRVVQNTHDDAEVIVVDGAHKYDKWNRLFGFKVLNNVPLTHETDDEPHDYDVPSGIHNEHINKGSDNTGKADDVLDRSLKIRNTNDSSSIDFRLSIEEAQSRLEHDTRNFGKGSDKLVVFPRSAEENISDNYSVANYAAIASVTAKEFEALADYEDVLTFEEYKEWSRSALIATEDGAMTPGELIQDDRLVVLTYRPSGDHDVVKLLGDDFEKLRTLYAEDIRDQLEWASYLDDYDGSFRSDDIGNVDDADKNDTLFAVAGSIVLGRAEWAFKNLWREEGYTSHDLSCLTLTGRKFKYSTPAEWNRLSESTTRYRLMADTPNWDDDSAVYEWFPNSRDSWKAQVLLGFHDRDINPVEEGADNLRDLIGDDN